jgi:broad specificity phosphatase PhoE
MQRENPQNYCTLYIVRHGETEWNVKRIMQGHKDSPLTEKGIKQVEEVSEELKHIHFDAIFSSDLPRTLRTAEIMNLERELVVQTSHLLRERAHGSFEGRTLDEYHEILKDKLLEAERLSGVEAEKYKLSPDIESDEEVTTRLLTKLREISVAYPDKNVLVVTHGGCLRIFLVKTGYATSKELQFGAISNAGYAKVMCDGVDFIVKEVKGVTKVVGGE